MILIVCGLLAPTCGGGPSGPREPVRSTNCTPEQHARIEDALAGVCRVVAVPGGPCEEVLREFRVLQSLRRQCRRGLTVRCAEKGCGQYFRRNPLYLTDDGTIEIGLGGLYGGMGCGGRDGPTLGPAHTMTHEMAHAAGIVSEQDAERVAYACRLLNPQP